VVLGANPTRGIGEGGNGANREQCDDENQGA